MKKNFFYSFLILAATLFSCEKEEEKPQPVIESFSPATGAKGTVITVVGKNFGKSPRVFINGGPHGRMSAPLGEVSDASLTFTIPEGATTGTIEIVSNDKTARSTEQLIILYPPVITAFEPSHGPIGSEIKIQGANLSNLTVKINGTQLTTLDSSLTHLLVKVTAGVTSGKLSIESADGNTESEQIFTVDPHSITNVVHPSSGAEATFSFSGQELSVNGDNFSLTSADNIVKLNGVVVPVKSTSTAKRLDIEIPDGATTGRLSVTVGTLSVESPKTLTIRPGKWIKKNSMPSEIFGAAASFAINDKGYVVEFESHPDLTRTLWEYNVVNDSWIKRSSFIVGQNVKSETFVINGNGYLGSSQQLWEFSSSTGNWNRKNDLPFGPVNLFAVANRAFMIDYKSKFFEYSSGTDAWIEKTDAPNPLRTDASIATHANKVYIGLGQPYTGINAAYLTDLWEYDVSADAWSKKADFPGEGRSRTFTFSVNGKIYVGGGGNRDKQFTDMWVYDISNNSWEESITVLPQSPTILPFVIGNKVYVVDTFEQVWEFVP